MTFMDHITPEQFLASMHKRFGNSFVRLILMGHVTLGQLLTSKHC